MLTFLLIPERIKLEFLHGKFHYYLFLIRIAKYLCKGGKREALDKIPGEPHSQCCLSSVRRHLLVKITWSYPCQKGTFLNRIGHHLRKLLVNITDKSFSNYCKRTGKTKVGQDRLIDGSCLKICVIKAFFKLMRNVYIPEKTKRLFYLVFPVFFGLKRVWCEHFYCLQFQMHS